MANRITFSLVMPFLCICATLLPAVAQDKGDAAKKDAAMMQGTWNFVAMEMDGQKLPKMEPPQIITFQGDKFEVKLGDTVVQAGTQKLDPSKNPKTVDATVTEGEGKGTTMLGIYEVKGDSLKACFDPAGKMRPTEFKSTAGSGIMLVVLERQNKK